MAIVRETDCRIADGRVLRGCEQKFLEWIRSRSVPFGRLTARVTVDYQDGVPVAIKVGHTVEVEEKFR